MDNKDIENENIQEEKRDSSGILFGILGVCTLLITIVGATYAYFTAKASSDDVIQGSAAATGLDLFVEKVSDEPDSGLVPMLDSDIQKGLTGENGKMCVDVNGNAVCQLYKVTVTNRSEATVPLSSTLTITPVALEGTEDSVFTNLKWAEITSETDATLIGNANLLSVTEWKKNHLLKGNETKDFYVLLWISETSNDQSDLDKGSYVGTVSFNTVYGVGVTAMFSGGI